MLLFHRYGDWTGRVDDSVTIEKEDDLLYMYYKEVIDRFPFRLVFYL